MTEKEAVKSVPFTTTAKNYTQLGINIAKYVRDFYNENHKI